MSGFCAAAAAAPAPSPPPVTLHLAEAISLSLTGEVSLFFLNLFLRIRHLKQVLLRHSLTSVRDPG